MVFFVLSKIKSSSFGRWIKRKKRELTFLKMEKSRKYDPKSKKTGWFGNFDTWEQVGKFCTGYDDDIIFEKVLASALLVKKGEAAYERDSVVFSSIQYSWPVTAFICRAGIENASNLTIIDFGGALGTHYYQNKSFISGFKNISWRVVEQDKFVNFGKEMFEDGVLSFHNSILSAADSNTIDVLLFSSVLPYLKNPDLFLQQALTAEPKYIIIDRTYIIAKRRLVIQVVPPSIYSAKYPCWFLTEAEIVEALSKKYVMVNKFEALEGAIWSDVKSMGYVFKLI